jgi:chemotaxis protein MotB
VPEDIGGEGHAQAPIFKKVKKVEGGHHGGAWKVAYADFVTAMMALFIVLWILGQTDDVKMKVAGYFRDPVGFREGGVPSIQDGGTEITPMEIIESNVDSMSNSATEGQSLDQLWRERAERIRGALEGLPSFSNYENQIELAITPEGLRISLIESDDTPLYQLGSTDLSPDARAFLETIANQIRELDNHIIIEGHTDSRPFAAGSEMNNWALSTGRSNTAREVLKGAGIDASRFYEVRGLADRQLYNPLDPLDSRNRRVSITLLSEAAYDERQKIGKTTIID